VAALPRPVHPWPVLPTNRPKLPPPEPLALFKRRDKPTFDQLLAKRLSTMVQRRSLLVGAVVDALAIQVIILTIALVVRSFGS
jgi:hypothetical protein